MVFVPFGPFVELAELGHQLATQPSHHLMIEIAPKEALQNGDIFGKIADSGKCPRDDRMRCKSAHASNTNEKKMSRTLMLRAPFHNFDHKFLCYVFFVECICVDYLFHDIGRPIFGILFRLPFPTVCARKIVNAHIVCMRIFTET